MPQHLHGMSAEASIDMFGVLTAFVLFLIVTGLVLSARSLRKFSGPRCKPLLGNWNSVKRGALEEVCRSERWASKHGPLVRVLIGRTPCLLVTESKSKLSYDAVYHAPKPAKQPIISSELSCNGALPFGPKRRRQPVSLASKTCPSSKY